MIFKLGGLLRRRRIERRTLRIGYMPSLDAAPLIVAQLGGFFEDEGLDVQLQRLTSWPKAHQKLAARELDAAHMPATGPLCAHLGIEGYPVPLRTAFVMSLGGSSFGVNPELFAAIQAKLQKQEKPPVSDVLSALARVVADRRLAGASKLRFAVSDTHSVGSYDLRYCLASAGIDPATDVSLVAITPGRVQKSLHDQSYDGAWVDEPFGSLAAKRGDIKLLFTKHAYWNNSLAKVLAVPASLVTNYPKTHAALLRALLQAGLWLEENRGEAQTLIASKQGLDMDVADLDSLNNGVDTLCGQTPMDMSFGAGTVNFPWYSQAVWYLGQMIRWGDYQQVVDFKKTAQQVFLPASYRVAARELSLPYPSIGYKNEGEHDQVWTLEEASTPVMVGADLFFDGRLYKPRQTMKYLNGLEISHITAPLDAMWAIR